MTDSNKANDLNDRTLNAATQLDSNASQEVETQNTESLNIDDIDLETLERLTNPDANSTMSEENSQKEESDSQSMAQATLSGNSYSMAHSNYIAEDSHFDYENDLSKQALSNVSDNSNENVADDLCADDIALAVSNFNSPSSTIGASTVSSQKDQNNTEQSSLGASADLEVSNMLQESEPSQDNASSTGVDVTMPQEEEPRLKIYDTPSTEESQEINPQATESESTAATESDTQVVDTAQSADLSQDAEQSSSDSSSDSATTDSGVMKGATMLDTSTAISGSSERVVTPVEQSSSTRTMTPEELAMIAQAGSAFSRSSANTSADDSADLSSVDSAVDSVSASESSSDGNGLVIDESIEVPEKGVMKGAKMLDTSTAISGSTERVVTPVEQSSSSRTMSAEELAMIAEAGSAFSRSSSVDSSTDNTDNDSGLVVDESIEVPEKGVMKGAKMLDTSTAISGIEERVVTPVEQSSSSRTMTPEELAMIAQAGSAFSRSASLDASEGKSASENQDAGAVDSSGLVVDESIEVPEKGVMKGAKMLDTSTAISGIEERVITPVEQSSSSRTMTPEELAIIAMAGGSTPKSPTSGMTPLTIEPRENDLFHQTGSSNIARDINSIQSGSTTNLFKDATVMEEGHTAIVGLDNRMVASETPDTSTVITGLSASYIDQIQAVNEMAARQNQEHFEAKAKFEEEMAAEQAQAALAQDIAQAHAQAQDQALENESDASEGLEGYEDQGNLDYSLYDGIADPNYHKSEQADNAADGEQPYYDNSGDYYDESQEALVKNTNDTHNYYDYSQYDESEVQAMPTDIQEKEDDGPNYVVGVHENFNAEAAAKSNQQDDNPYSYGTYANKLAHQNAMRQGNDLEQDPELYSSAISDQDNFTSSNEANSASEPQEEAPLYYGTYASRLAQENALRNKNKVNTPPRYQSPAEFEQNERARAQERALAKERAMAEANLESGFDQEISEEHHSPEPSGMGDGALSQLNLKNSIEPDDGPKYYMSKDKLANKANRDDGPVYLVGVKRNKGELNAQRSKIIHDESLESYDDMPTPEEEAAYMQELADAARESMAAPNSEVVKRARMLAAQGENSNLDDSNGALLEGSDINNSSSNPELFDGINNNAPATNAEANSLMAAKADELARGSNLNQDATSQELNDTELKQQQLNANQRKEEDGNYNFSNMAIKDNVGFGMMIFLYIRQLIASFFSHTTLPLIAPNLSKNLGQSYPSSMPIPFFFVGLIAGAIGSILHSTIELDYVGSISYLIYLLLTGLTAYRGIHRICAFISRKWKRDSVLSSASVMVPMLIFIWLANTLIVKTDGIVEATASFAIASMMAAATASSLTWNFPQDPMDSIGNMSTKGLLFVIILSIMASFGLLHYTVGLSVFGVSILVRLIFGYFIAKNQGTANRPYVYALQLITLFAILFDMILLKSQNYEFLSKSSLELVAYLRHYSHFF